MPTTANALYDIMVRHSLLMEGLKEYQLAQFARAASSMENDLRRELQGIEVGALDELDRKRLNALIKSLQDIEDDHIRRYFRSLVQFLRRYLRIDRVMLNRILANESEDTYVAAPPLADLWDTARETPMGANGLTLSAMLTAYLSDVQNSTKNQVMRGVADKVTPTELLATFLGTNALAYRDGQLNRMRNQANTTIRTAMQQTFATLEWSVMGLYTDRYMWSSILDAVTTDICRSRNGRVYVRGQGPMPPAHYNCRSSVVPIRQELGKPDVPSSFYSWIKTQPPNVWAEVLPVGIYNKLRANTLRSRDLPAYDRAQPLTLNQYEQRRNLVATGSN